MNIDLITIREAELKAELTRLRESIDAVEKELDELTIAKGVFLRLTGKAKAPASTSAPKRAKFPRPAQKKPEELPTIRNLVFEALMDARQRGLPGLAPRQIGSTWRSATIMKWGHLRILFRRVCGARRRQFKRIRRLACLAFRRKKSPLTKIPWPERQQACSKLQRKAVKPVREVVHDNSLATTVAAQVKTWVAFQNRSNNRSSTK
ncbi:hypothetical protein [Neoaquamicrobium sediminum]|uniref:hypothetical protein n=1 Tax=Neoaquamicrobium sediminum TaxID=1849104 RepID=UPI0015657F32|nr:hypothetical protein [Mesorhizobium sediminum]NRC53270.1 hypothetical protein [Mesorhizobium sediminum]